MTPISYSSSQNRNDCVVRALANAANLDYDAAFELCREAGRKDGRGMHRSLWIPLFERCVGIQHSAYLSDFKTVKSLSKKLAQRGGTYLVLVRGHVAVYRDGEWLDWIDSNRRHRVLWVWVINSN